MPRAVDDLDGAILRELRRDADLTNAEIGARVGLTEGAVRYRVARLRADGILLRSTVITRPLGPEGLVLIRCRPGQTAGVVERVRAMSSDLFETSGEYDLAAAVEARSMEEFNAALDAIRALPGVEQTATLIRLTRYVGEEPTPPASAPPSAPSPRSGPVPGSPPPRPSARSRDRSRRSGA